MNDPFFQIEPIERAEGEIRNGFVALVQNPTGRITRKALPSESLIIGKMPS